MHTAVAPDALTGRWMCCAGLRHDDWRRCCGWHHRGAGRRRWAGATVKLHLVRRHDQYFQLVQVTHADRSGVPRRRCRGHNRVCHRWLCRERVECCVRHREQVSARSRCHALPRIAGVGCSEAFDVSTGTWKTGLPNLPTPRLVHARWLCIRTNHVADQYDFHDRYGLSAAAVGTTVYAIGGSAWHVPASSAVEAYDTTTSTWSTMAAMPTARCASPLCLRVAGLHNASAHTLDVSPAAARTLRRLSTARQFILSAGTTAPRT